MEHTRLGHSTKITLRDIWNEANRNKLVDTIRASGLKFGSAIDNEAFTFEVDAEASKFEFMVEKLTNHVAAIYRD